MKRRGPARRWHRAGGLFVSLGMLLLTVTGLGLLHPEWFGRPGTVATVVAADPFAPNRLLRASPFVLEESRDGGVTWQDLPCGWVPAIPVACRFAARDTGVVWLLGADELLVSDDGGAVWDIIDLPTAIGYDEPARDLTLAGARFPVLTTDRHGWRFDGEAWQELWHVPPTRADVWRRWFQRLHSGHWGPSVIARVHDGVAVVTLLVLFTGLVLFRRRNGNGRQP